jgi:hypothetical protein
MKAPRFLLSKTSSKCCQAKALVVQSRAGGYISQNCLKCGKSYRIHEHALPDLDCDVCARSLRTERVDGKNYFYVCKQGNRNWKIGDTVPHWGELFAYCGLAVDRDRPVAG